MIDHPITWEAYFIVRFGFAFLLIAVMLMLLFIGVVAAMVRATW